MAPEEYIYNSFWRLAARSLVLDWQWITTPHIPNKYIFLLKKYLFILTSYTIRLWGRDLALENKHHIGIIQSTFTNNTYLKSLLPKHPIVVDIGAHAGEFALFCEIYLRATSIFSFEPIQSSYTLLKHNVRTHVYHTAIGTTPTQTMYIPEHTAMASGLPTSSQDTVEVVPCRTLDSIPEIASLPSIDLLKIDVEGMEYDVLRASTKSIQKATWILLEVSIDRPVEKPALETLAYLQTIIPNVELFHIGQIFGSQERTDSVDLLFRTSL